MATSVLPNLIVDLDEVLAAESAQLVQGEDASLVLSYGQSLAFDWRTKRFRLDAEGAPVVVSGQAALLEDILKMLFTARFTVPIYSDDYGSEFDDLLGLPMPVAMTQIETMIRETLLVDDRIAEVQTEVRALAADQVGATLIVRDFNGLLLELPEVSIRYGD